MPTEEHVGNTARQPLTPRQMEKYADLVAAGKADHALEVARKRQQTGWTQAKLAAHFGRSRPTIRHALEMARNMRDGPADDAVPPDRQNPKAG